MNETDRQFLQAHPKEIDVRNITSRLHQMKAADYINAEAYREARRKLEEKARKVRAYREAERNKRIEEAKKREEDELRKELNQAIENEEIIIRDRSGRYYHVDKKNHSVKIAAHGIVKHYKVEDLLNPIGLKAVLFENAEVEPPIPIADDLKKEAQKLRSRARSKKDRARLNAIREGFLPKTVLIHRKK